MKKSNGFLKAFIISLVVILLAGGGYYFYKITEEKKSEQARTEQAEKERMEHDKLVYDTINDNNFYEGILIQGHDVSGLSKEEAIAELQEIVSEIAGKKITANIENNSRTATLEELGVSVNLDKTIEEAYAYARVGSSEDRFNLVNDLKENNKDFPFVIDYDGEKIQEFVNIIEENTNQISTSATVSFVNGKLTVKEGEKGKKLDKEGLKDRIKTSIEDAIAKNTDVSLDAKMEELSEEENEGKYARINGVIGKFTTNLGKGTAGRNANIILSTERISNIVVMPGETISFNQRMGEITIENGYKNASTIQNGKYEDALGGGLCQTSTTLYNALVRSDIKIVERHPHSIPAPYVPYGEDGAVWAGSKDLKFTNNWDFPIAIVGSVDLKSNTMTFVIYGDTTEKDYEVQMYSKITDKIPFETVEKEDPSLPAGEKKVQRQGRNGYKVQSYKVYSKGGKAIKEEPYYKSSYPRIDEIVLVGTGGAAPTEPIENENLETEEEQNEAVDLLQ
ncbi:MAG: VanW family protein [Ezakiella sp.]|nr:VanW family protein [Ezakiella sp.]MDD7472242.1 VanW family protein [Bacillota bacterium]MDY3923757.1 VanW family protein [Ezakiella sp.]